MEKINAVEMVRKIRDKQYEETKKLSRAELLKYFNKNGGKALNNFRKKYRAPKGTHSSVA
jgi:hypothetical protein